MLDFQKINWRRKKWKEKQKNIWAPFNGDYPTRITFRAMLQDDRVVKYTGKPTPDAMELLFKVLYKRLDVVAFFGCEYDRNGKLWSVSWSKEQDVDGMLPGQRILPLKDLLSRRSLQRHCHEYKLAMYHPQTFNGRVPFCSFVQYMKYRPANDQVNGQAVGFEETRVLEQQQPELGRVRYYVIPGWPVNGLDVLNASCAWQRQFLREPKPRPKKVEIAQDILANDAAIRAQQELQRRIHEAFRAGQIGWNWGQPR